MHPGYRVDQASHAHLAGVMGTVQAAQDRAYLAEERAAFVQSAQAVAAGHRYVGQPADQRVTPLEQVYGFRQPSVTRSQHGASRAVAEAPAFAAQYAAEVSDQMTRGAAVPRANLDAPVRYSATTPEQAFETYDHRERGRVRRHVPSDAGFGDAYPGAPDRPCQPCAAGQAFPPASFQSVLWNRGRASTRHPPLDPAARADGGSHPRSAVVTRRQDSELLGYESAPPPPGQLGIISNGPGEPAFIDTRGVTAPAERLQHPNAKSSDPSLASIEASNAVAKYRTVLWDRPYYEVEPEQRKRQFESQPGFRDLEWQNRFRRGLGDGSIEDRIHNPDIDFMIAAQKTVRGSTQRDTERFRRLGATRRALAYECGKKGWGKRDPHMVLVATADPTMPLRNRTNR